MFLFLSGSSFLFVGKLICSSFKKFYLGRGNEFESERASDGLNWKGNPKVTQIKKSDRTAITDSKSFSEKHVLLVKENNGH